MYEGLIQAVPYNSSSGVVPVSAAGWTAQNTATDNVIDAAQALLTFDHLNELMSIVEDAKGNGALTDFAMSAKPIARMRNPVEFEMFQTIKDIGSKAALIRGSVGDFYGANIISSGFVPNGTDTVPLDVDDATTGLVQNSTDTMVLGFDRRAAVISQRRGIEMRTEHAFHQDVEEVRFLERVGFKVLRPEWTVLLGDVKNAAVV